MRPILRGIVSRAFALSIAAVAACDQSGGGRVNDERRQAAGACRPARTATQLTNLVGQAIGPANWTVGESLTPPLPARWPDVRSGGVVFLTYKFVPLPTGRVTARVRGPIREIAFATLDAEPVVQMLEGEDLGIDGGSSDEIDASQLATATEALIEMIAGCRSEADAHVVLAPYRIWLGENQPIGKHLEQRLPAFIAWLRSGR